MSMDPNVDAYFAFEKSILVVYLWDFENEYCKIKYNKWICECKLQPSWCFHWFRGLGLHLNVRNVWIFHLILHMVGTAVAFTGPLFIVLNRVCAQTCILFVLELFYMLIIYIQPLLPGISAVKYVL